VWDHLRLLTPTDSRCRQRFSLMKEEGLQNVIMQALLFSIKQDIESCSYPRCLKSDCLGTLANKHYGLCERVRSPRAGGASPCMRSSWPRDSRIISSSHQQPRRNSCIRVKCGSTRAAIAAAPRQAASLRGSRRRPRASSTTTGRSNRRDRASRRAAAAARASRRTGAAPPPANGCRAPAANAWGCCGRARGTSPAGLPTL
jgi:hypothetical protein